jgi:hypothetical protein
MEGGIQPDGCLKKPRCGIPRLFRDQWSCERQGGTRDSLWVGSGEHATKCQGDPGGIHINAPVIPPKTSVSKIGREERQKLIWTERLESGSQ